MVIKVLKKEYFKQKNNSKSKKYLTNTKNNI